MDYERVTSAARFSAPASRSTCMIVEDQALIGLALEAYLEDVGIEASDPLTSAADALGWLRTNTPSFAVLDYRLKDGCCTALSRALKDRGVPFVIYSALPREVAPAELQDVTWISKPCPREALISALIGTTPALKHETNSSGA